jgi:hypothetical protein
MDYDRDARGIVHVRIFHEDLDMYPNSERNRSDCTAGSQ